MKLTGKLRKFNLNLLPIDLLTSKISKPAMEMDINTITRLSTETWSRVLENERDIKQIKKSLPEIVRFLNKVESLEEWRLKENLWGLKKLEGDHLVFSQTNNGIETTVEMDRGTFQKIKSGDLTGFNIKTRDGQFREHVFYKDGLEINESFFNFIQKYKLPKGFSLTDPKKESSGVDKERILELLKTGKRTKDVAKEMNCSESYVSQLKKKLTKQSL